MIKPEVKISNASEYDRTITIEFIFNSKTLKDTSVDTVIDEVLEKARPKIQDCISTAIKDYNSLAESTRG